MPEKELMNQEVFVHDHEGTQCPVCFSSILAASHKYETVNNFTVKREIACHTCGSTWYEYYVLNRYKMLNQKCTECGRPNNPGGD